MSIVGLSTGCFTGHHQAIEGSGVRFVELSSHRPAAMPEIALGLERERTKVVSVHSPCPGRGPSVDLAADGHDWDATAAAIEDTMSTAAQFDARYVVIHAFYCLPAQLPVDDIARMDELRRLFPNGGDIRQYVKSSEYAEAQARATGNLKSLLPRLKARYPRQRIVLENLNPRLGYGGIHLDHVLAVAAEFGGDVGICLDIGHLALAESALREEMDLAVERARELIWTTHIHQNFGGRHALERFWFEEKPHDPPLQEIDTHLPLLSRFQVLEQIEQPRLGSDNSAFERTFEGYAIYAKKGAADEHPVAPLTVDVARLLRHVPSTANRILELDSRFSPLAEILEEYDMASRGVHPAPLWGNGR
ncbi:sugar phosphate isomerase/epimerase family protein [Bradyrhizobium sp. HKCCYLS1011]|uniref:sugar phosphate isomerase/epimerase family protein n=1 Tax=Bradyrhizobium sp. HKCCYLS1011 TaxID=3420733 RepID=UPI003EBC3737